MKKKTFQVPTGHLYSIRILELHAGVLSGISISIFRVEFAPFILHILILRLSTMFPFSKGSVNVRAGFRLPIGRAAGWDCPWSCSGCGRSQSCFGKPGQEAHRVKAGSEAFPRSRLFRRS